MDYIAIAALVIFVATLILMIKRPKGIKLGYAAGLGALASLLLGTVTLSQAAGAFVDIWDAALAFIGIVAFSVVLDAMGFFKWAALKVVKLAKGSGLRLYVYVSLLTAAVSILFANDSAVLILTPIVLEIIIALKIDGKGRMAYLFAAGLIADTAAMPLITSNPINILSADYFGYTFIDHLVFMAPIAVATIVSSMAIVYLFFRKKIPKTYDTTAVDILAWSTPIKPKLLKVCIATLVAVDVGYVAASNRPNPRLTGHLFRRHRPLSSLHGQPKRRNHPRRTQRPQRLSPRHQLGHQSCSCLAFSLLCKA